MPPDVFAVVQGARAVAEAVIDNVDYLQFTGSSATGRKVMERAARRLTPVSLELGGKDPMIVLDDADIGAAAHAAVWGAMFNAGQTCVSVERVYVLESVYDRFVDAVVRDVEALKVGAGEGFTYGALIDEDQLAITDRHVREAVRRRCARPDRWPTRVARRRAGQLLSADCAGRRRPLDVLHDRGDLRPHPADHEGRQRRGGRPAGQRQPVRPERLSVLQRHRTRQCCCVATGLRYCQRQRRDQQSDVPTAPMGGWKESGIGPRFGGADGLRKFCRAEVVVEPRTKFGAESTLTVTRSKRWPGRTG